MILIEIPDNPNCTAVDLRVFHDLAPAQSVSQVRLARSPGPPGNRAGAGGDGNGGAGARDGAPAQWYDVTGWTLSGDPCPAWLQKVDDSGDGVAFLLYGGEAGLRLRPTGIREPWDREASQQWGEPFLIIADQDDIRLQTPAAAGQREDVHG